MSFRVMPLALKNNVKASETDISGPGRFTSLASETGPSLRPVGTWYLGPPARATESRVARVMMSAQETLEGQATSKAFLMVSMRS